MALRGLLGTLLDPSEPRAAGRFEEASVLYLAAGHWALGGRSPTTVQNKY